MSDINEMNVGLRWYVAHTYSGYENKVKQNLEQIVKNRGMEDVITDIRIPTETVVESDGSRDKEVESKIMPAYVFIKMVMTDETWHIVRNITGVTRICRTRIQAGTADRGRGRGVFAGGGTGYDQRRHCGRRQRRHRGRYVPWLQRTRHRHLRRWKRGHCGCPDRGQRHDRHARTQARQKGGGISLHGDFPPHRPQTMTGAGQSPALSAKHCRSGRKIKFFCIFRQKPHMEGNYYGKENYWLY